jgi:hypothetical protein
LSTAAEVAASCLHKRYVSWTQGGRPKYRCRDCGIELVEDESPAAVAEATSPDSSAALNVPELALARAYLEALTGEKNPAVTFQTFSDVKPKTGKDSLACWLHGTLDQHAAELERRNNRGAGIFIMVNEGDGRGRKAENVVHIRALYADRDRPGARPPALAPSFSVTTSPGKKHDYLLVAGEMPLEDFTPFQETLADYCGSDRSVNDLPRVARLPGFYHRKKTPVLVTFEPGSGRSYTPDEIRAAHPVKPKAIPPPKPKTNTPRPAAGSRREKLMQIVREKAEGRDWTEGNRHASAKETAAHGRKLGLEAEELALLVVDFAERAGLSREEAEPIVEWAMASVTPDPNEKERPRVKAVAEDVHIEESAIETSSEPKLPDPLAREAFYGLAGEFVRLVSPHTEADEAALMAHFVVYFGNAVGRDAFFRVGATRHTAAENVAFVGVTGSGRKGTAEHETRRPFLLAEDPWVARITTGLSTGEGLIHAVRDAIEKREPIRERGRVTGYENVIADDGVQDKRLCVVESELGRVLRVMERDGNTLSATIREAWDAREVLRTLTKSSPSVATGAHVSIIGHITRDELLRYLDRTETANGFGNRFFWVAVSRSKFLPDGGTLRDEDLVPFVSKLRDALATARNVREMARDAEASAAWHGVYEALETGRTGLFGAITGRAAPHVLRLSMIYALMDGSAVIQEPHLAAGLALWTYSEDSARFVFGDATGDPEADTIADALRTTPRLSREAISNLFSRHVPAQRIAAALALLARLGKAHTVKQATGGRPVEFWMRGTSRREESEESAKSPSDTAEDPPFPRLDRFPRNEART